MKIKNSKLKIQNIHFVGIKGVGVTPLALIAKEAGIKVTGSDIEERFITDELLEKAGITVYQGFSKDHVGRCDLVITTGAHGGFQNEEVRQAQSLSIPVMSQGEAVGAFMKGDVLERQFVGISVAGSHGKTTTTAMIATVLKDGGMDPSYLVGTGSIPSLGLPGHLGKGSYFIAEADEYVTSIGQDAKHKLLWQHPKIAVVTNIEFDHPDVFEDEGAVRKVFVAFANQLPANGVLVTCGDDKGVSHVLQQFLGKRITYGFSKSNDYYISHTHTSQPYTFFKVKTGEAVLSDFVIKAAGDQNALDALASIIVGLEVGLDVAKIKDALKSFSGTKRRGEFIGYGANGALIYDDYAHHPTEIKKTLSSFRKQFPESKIVCIFQPHMYSRTKKLFEQFVHSFVDADTVILTDIYPSLREQSDPTVSSELLYQKMKEFYKNIIFCSKLEDVIKYVDENSYDSGTVVITMGAGDVYKITEKLVAKKI